MLLGLVKNSVISRTKISTLTVLMGLSSILGGCSVVMSADNETVIGAVADYTPFDMGDDESIFSNNSPKKPAYLQRTKTHFTNNQDVPLKDEAVQLDDSSTPSDSTPSQINATMSTASSVSPSSSKMPSAIVSSVMMTASTTTAMVTPKLPIATKTEAPNAPKQESILTEQDKKLPSFKNKTTENKIPAVLQKIVGAVNAAR